jgi:hypothetical protein
LRASVVLQPQGNSLHRLVNLGDGEVRALNVVPFSPSDSDDPERPRTLLLPENDFAGRDFSTLATPLGSRRRPLIFRPANMPGGA